ncbi:hypothetical protein [Spirilliplanes yamanashiensis]|nr:hypothetical protein [Spirilliplanes yamanashiensis]MDP9814974.1 hypothetical protein [Spirilliplanes yamanashiensis]
MQRALGTMAAAVVASGFAVTVVAAPAQAMTYGTVFADTWAYTDAALPAESFVGAEVNLPLGAARDTAGVDHVSRVYYSFDLAKAKGKVVHRAGFFTRDRSAADCAAAPVVEVRRVAAITARTSWRRPPAVLERLGTADTGGDCPAGHHAFDLRTVVQAAVDRGDSRLTLELRLQRGQERDARFGRTVAYRPSIDLWVNAAPRVESIALAWEQTCGTASKPDPVHGGRPMAVAAHVIDPDDQGGVRADFAAWPVGDPAARVERTSSAAATRPWLDWDISGYPHGTVVAWAARGRDADGDVSAWTEPCHVVIDREPPAKAPVVTSEDYPNDGGQHGGSGIEGTFRLDAQGDADVVRYRWSEPHGGTRYVDAPAPGAAATIRFLPRALWGNVLTVQSVDAAGNVGPATTYEFHVRYTEPDVELTVAGVGLPSPLRVRPGRVPDATSVGYRVGDAPEVRLPVVDGVAAGDIVFAERGRTTVSIRVYAGDRLAGVLDKDVEVDDRPGVTSEDFGLSTEGQVGRPGTFRFTPRAQRVSAYEWRVDDTGEWTRLDAGPDGSAELRWTPTRGGYETLHVRSVDAAGDRSDAAEYSFMVTDPRPRVSARELDWWPRRDGPGLPLTLTFETSVDDVAGFVYSFDGGPEQFVDVNAGGYGVEVVPAHAGPNTVVVRNRYTDGTLGPEGTTTVDVFNGPIVSSAQYPNGTGGESGDPAVFTFAPALPDVVDYRYEFDGEEETVAAGPDGRATVTLTPAHPGYRTLAVTSRSADGTESETRRYEFSVLDNKVAVSSDYDDHTPRGGAGIAARFGLSVEVGVTEYRYRLGDGPVQSAKPSGSVVTTVTVVPERAGRTVLTVWAVRPDGTETPRVEYPFLVGTEPVVSSAEYPSSTWSGGVGVPGTFRFSGGAPDVAAFEYRVEDAAPVVVPAGADGSATVTWTPTQNFGHTMLVRGRLADGTWTDTARYYILVN